MHYSKNKFTISYIKAKRNLGLLRSLLKVIFHVNIRHNMSSEIGHKKMYSVQVKQTLVADSHSVVHCTLKLEIGVLLEEDIPDKINYLKQTEENK